MIEEIEVQGYRSVRVVRMRMRHVLIVVGENGTGKSNLYGALQLFQAATGGMLARAIAEDGGMELVLWAGARKRGPVRMRIAARMDDFSYELVLGLSVPGDTAFSMDPVVKEERVLDGAVIVDRRGQSVTLRDVEGRPVTHAFDLWTSESVLARLSEPQRPRGEDADPRPAPRDARELSYGTLRCLCLMAALFSPRLPDDAREGARRRRRDPTGTEPVRLTRVNGETRIAGQALVDADEEFG